MTRNELLKLLILLARYVETYNESASDNDMNTLSDAYTVVQNTLLGCVDRIMTPVELFDIVDAQCRVVQEGADVKALEADNKRLRKELDDLKFLLDTNIRLGIKANEFIVEQAAEIKQLEIMLTQRTDGNRELINALKAVKAEQ